MPQLNCACIELPNRCSHAITHTYMRERQSHAYAFGLYCHHLLVLISALDCAARNAKERVAASLFSKEIKVRLCLYVCVHVRMRLTRFCLLVFASRHMPSHSRMYSSLPIFISQGGEGSPSHGRATAFERSRVVPAMTRIRDISLSKGSEFVPYPCRKEAAVVQRLL